MSTSDSENTLIVGVRSSGDSSPRISDALSSSKQDSLLGLNKKQVILQNSLLADGDTNLNPIEKSGTQSANSSSQDFIQNERSSMPLNDYSTKRKRDNSPDSCCIAVDDEGMYLIII
jgi:hypothetical protein